MQAASTSSRWRISSGWSEARQESGSDADSCSDCHRLHERSPSEKSMGQRINFLFAGVMFDDQEWPSPRIANPEVTMKHDTLSDCIERALVAPDDIGTIGQDDAARLIE